jgi:hypothetical protein
MHKEILLMIDDVLIGVIKIGTCCARPLVGSEAEFLANPTEDYEVPGFWDEFHFPYEFVSGLLRSALQILFVHVASPLAGQGLVN